MNQTAIGSYIARKRKEQNLTQEQLGRAAQRVQQDHLQVGEWKVYARLQHHSKALPRRFM